jgi:hypothetical protein
MREQWRNRGFLARWMNNEYKGKRLFYSKIGLVGRGKTSQRDNGYVIQLLMDNGPLRVKWQMTVAKAYGGVTWRQVIGGKSHRRGLDHEWKG